MTNFKWSKLEMKTILLLLFVLIIFGVIQGELVAAESSSSCEDVSWVPFKNEKCFRILDIPTRSYDDASKACDVLDGNPTLPIIESQEEQDFLTNFLYKINKNSDNFWIGSKFSGTTFKWTDSSALSYINWDKDAPRNNKANYCVQMQAAEAHQGKWIDAPCDQNNAIVCQKAQLWSSAKLQKILLETRKELKDSLEKANKEIVTLKQSNEESNKKITNLTQNPVPIGFIYVQLSSQPEPRTLWSTLEWKDVTTEYAGLFFRTEGGGAATFGTIQPENAPRVTEVTHSNQHGGARSDWAKTVLNPGGASSGIGVYSGSWYGEDHSTLQFNQSGGEVRPRNQAIRIWKRIK